MKKIGKMVVMSERDYRTMVYEKEALEATLKKVNNELVNYKISEALNNRKREINC